MVLCAAGLSAANAERVDTSPDRVRPQRCAAGVLADTILNGGAGRVQAQANCYKCALLQDALITACTRASTTSTCDGLKTLFELTKDPNISIFY